MMNDELELRLHALAEDMVFPPTPDLGVHTARQPRRRTILLYGMATLCLILVIVATPPARAAIQQLFDAAGIDIRISDSQNSERTLALLDDSLFGYPVSFDEAREAFGQPLLVPSTVLSTEPDQIYLYQTGDLISVTFAWAAEDDLPALDGSNIAAIFTQTVSSSDQPYLVKSIIPHTNTKYVEIERGSAWWIEGGELGTDKSEDTRSSAHVLIWLSADGYHAYRLESMLDQQTSIRIANSLVEWNPDVSAPVVGNNRTKASRGGLL
ncbi:MAG: hypothetical protein KC435_01265 [Thermomicrobiales bacterium]|nr:hypothetical protein [Thermomicrobiales bacterium]